MRTPTLLPIMMTCLLALAACEQPADTEAATSVAAAGAPQQPQTYKMTTQVPDNVLIPDKVETRLGTLEFFDGVPTAETSEKVWDHLDFSRAVESMIMTTPAASLVGFRRGIREFGPDNETAIIWELRLDSAALLLTGNTTVIYMFMWIDTKNGPVVIESPPDVLAIVDNSWFHYVTDIGNAGPDREVAPFLWTAKPDSISGSEPVV